MIINPNNKSMNRPTHNINEMNHPAKLIVYILSKQL